MSKRKLAALVCAALVSSLFVPGSARAATTYEIGVGQDFFEQGVPGFSGRFYPGSVKVLSGDMIHFDSSEAALLPAGNYPQEWIGANFTSVDSPNFFLVRDPDDGDKALKFNVALFEGEDCGTADNPCVWSDANDRLLFGGDEDLFVTIDAAPGSVLWAASIPSSDVNANLKIEVVGSPGDASTQAELNARATSLRSKDFEDALALHNKMSSKQTFHRNAAGKKVFDVFVGAAAGPIEMFASYPRRTNIRKGQRVQFHFMGQGIEHTATFGGPVARDLFRNGFMPVCDPDGDSGPGPDTPATFSETEPPCADMSQFEIDIDDRIPYEVGNGKVSGNSDYENSGFKFPTFPDGGTFDGNPWTERFTQTSGKKGFKFICLIHGGFMGGRVKVN
ncbi:MAG: hypothetical protein ACRDKB_11055 [Actinomycetota bacterium]